MSCIAQHPTVILTPSLRSKGDGHGVAGRCPTKGQTQVWELRHRNIRIYYSIEGQFIVVEEVAYEGTVLVHRLGTKNRQKRDIAEVKRRRKKRAG